MDNGKNGWNEWSKHVLAELERLNNNVDILNANQNAMSDTINEIDSMVKVLRDQVSGKDGVIDKTTDHETRIRKVEEFAYKHMGMLIGAGFIFNILLAIGLKIFLK
jgi:hypothetical protein